MDGDHETCVRPDRENVLRTMPDSRIGQFHYFIATIRVMIATTVPIIHYQWANQNRPTVPKNLANKGCS